MMRNRDKLLLSFAKIAEREFKRGGLTEESAKHEGISFAYSACEILANRLDEAEQARCEQS